MSLYRYNINLALPKPIPNVFDTKPTSKELTWISNHTWIEIIREAILRLKAHSVIINPEKPNVEDTIKAVYHICYHDETPPKPCETPVDI